ncbi:hypothetical protein JCM33374_g592 [Metschnikowia sp. JCM 33374]|nr:hypothetical protein JCM33374_g592 [Metschnikowia sp. JCM 33374]
MLASKPFLPKHRFHSTKPSANLIGGHAECTQSSISGTQRSSLHLKEIKNKKKNCPSPRYFDTSVSNSNRKKTREYLQETLDTEVGSMKLTEPKAFTNNLNTSHGLPNSHSKSTLEFSSTFQC